MVIGSIREAWATLSVAQFLMKSPRTPQKDVNTPTRQTGRIWEKTVEKAVMSPNCQIFVDSSLFVNQH